MNLMRLLVPDTSEQTAMPEHASFQMLRLLEDSFIYLASIPDLASGLLFAEHAAGALIYILPKHHDSFLSLFTPTLFCSGPEWRCSARHVWRRGCALPG